MTESTELQWWGYKHTDGSVLLKRYFSEQDISEARESPFVLKIIGPFSAPDSATARAMLTVMLRLNPEDSKYRKFIKLTKLFEDILNNAAVTQFEVLDYGKVEELLDALKEEEK